MRMNPVEFEGAQPPITGYAPGGFRIAGGFHEGALLLGPGGLAPWAVGDPLDAAAAEALIAMLADRVDVLLLGMGPDIAPAPAAFRTPLDAAGIALEPLATPTACRTYNVLLAEGRRVAAALKPI